AITRVNRENADAKALVANRGAADEQRKAETAKLVRQANELSKKGDYATAERVAMQAKQLDPDNPAITAMSEMIKTTRRVKEAEKLKADKASFFLDSLNGAEREGPYVDTMDPLAVNIQRQLIAARRGRGDDAYLRTRTPKEFEIELNLDKQ